MSLHNPVEPLPPEPNDSQALPRHRRKSRRLLWMLLAVAVLGLIGWGLHHRQASALASKSAKAGNDKGAVKVRVHNSERRDLTVWRDVAAQVRPLEQVVIRPQVSGQIVAIHVQDGQRVQRGQLLAELDARQADAERLSAQADIERLKTALANAQAEQSRYRQLLAIDAVSRQEADQASSQVGQLQAQLRAAHAQLAGKQLGQAQRQIRAPFAGRLGMKQVSVGAQVSPSDSAGLVTLTQTDPIAVDFGLPETNLDAPVMGRPVEVWSLQGEQKLASGQINRVDSTVDAATASLPVRTLIANGAERFFPGQSVRVRVLARQLKQVLVVPMAAVQQGPEGHFVWTVQNGQAVRVAVGLQEQIGEQAVVTGLGEQVPVIGSGFERIKAGQAVEVLAQDKRDDRAPGKQTAAPGDETKPPADKKIPVQTATAPSTPDPSGARPLAATALTITAVAPAQARQGAHP